jgi:hypothetical protein
MKTIAAVLFCTFCLAICSARVAASAKDDQAAAARAAAGCGPSGVEFEVKADKKQHPMAQLEPGKALVYFLHVETQDGGVISRGWVTTRVGVDGNWVGANHGKSYFSLAVNPGEHALCTDWQSIHKMYSRQSAAMNLNAEAGKIYYVRTTVAETTEHQREPAMKIEAIDSAEGQLLISSSALSTAAAKK